MDAYVLGAVPPYSYLLGGKLVSMLALSNEVRSLFVGVTRGGEVSSLARDAAASDTPDYNFCSGPVVYVQSPSRRWRSVLVPCWFDKGYGEFQFSNGLYSTIRSFADRFCDPTAKQSAWGKGFRNKREVVRKALQTLGFGKRFLNHGVKREIFVAPLGADVARFLRGEVSRPRFHDWPAAALAQIALRRWVLPRAERDNSFREFTRDLYRLWE